MALDDQLIGTQADFDHRLRLAAVQPNPPDFDLLIPSLNLRPIWFMVTGELAGR